MTNTSTTRPLVQSQNRVEQVARLAIEVFEKQGKVNGTRRLRQERQICNEVTLESLCAHYSYFCPSLACKYLLRVNHYVSTFPKAWILPDTVCVVPAVRCGRILDLSTYRAEIR